MSHGHGKHHFKKMVPAMNKPAHNSSTSAQVKATSASSNHKASASFSSEK